MTLDRRHFLAASAATASGTLLSACATTPAPAPLADTLARDPQLSTFTRLAAQSGLTETGAFQNSPGNHDARIYGSDGRGLVFGSRKATLLTANTGCRRTDGESVWVGNQIPMPPNPAP